MPKYLFLLDHPGKFEGREDAMQGLGVDMQVLEQFGAFQTAVVPGELSRHTLLQLVRDSLILAR